MRMICSKICLLPILVLVGLVIAGGVVEVTHSRPPVRSDHCHENESRRTSDIQLSVDPSHYWTCDGVARYGSILWRCASGGSGG